MESPSRVATRTGVARLRPAVEPLLPTFAVAAATFVLAYDGGTYGLASRDSAAVLVWWGLVLFVLAGFWPLARLGRPALATGALLAAFAAVNLASTAWAASAENAYSEFNRAALYVGVFFLASLGASRLSLVRWSDGLALGIVAVGLLALFSRFFPDVISTGGALQFLPSASARLSYPLEYWNGLAILIGIGVPLLLRAAVDAASLVARALAILPIPALAAAVYLTSSRGGVLAATVGGVAFLVLTPSRLATVAAALAAAAGAAGAVAAVVIRSKLVNHPGLSAAGEGHSAAILVAVSCLGAGLVYYGGLRLLGSRVAAATARVGPNVRRAVAVVVLLLLAGGVAAAHPVRRFETFKRAPPSVNTALPKGKNPLQRHFLSGGSSGRWQQWETVLKEFESAPVGGRGAGSYEAWWAQHGNLRGYVKDAHSLYLETLGELGIVGFVFVVGAFLTGIGVGLSRALRSRGPRRATVAAVWAAFLAYAVAAGVDWMWEMTVVSIVGIALLGLLTARASSPGEEPPSRLRRRWDYLARGALAVVGALVIAAEAVSLLTNRDLQASQRAAARGDLNAAAADADSARKLEPWAASPYIQLALVAERDGRIADARGWIEKAISRDRTNWRLWLLASRFDVKLGNIAAAKREVNEAMRLNPRSDIWRRR